MRFGEVIAVEEKIVEMLGKGDGTGIDGGIGDVAIACHVLRELRLY